MIVHADAMEELREPLRELGLRWARSPHRPRPKPESLTLWDRLLEDWASSDLPLLLRDSRRRGERTRSLDGREVIFGDNTPANWAFACALEGECPDHSVWSPDTLAAAIPLSLINRSGFKRDLNRIGWKVCHIDGVSDRKRYKVEEAHSGTLIPRFQRFMSPRNMFLIPKVISGAGELPDVVSAVADFERVQALNGADLPAAVSGMSG